MNELDVRIVQLDLATLRALADGDLEAARAASGDVAVGRAGFHESPSPEGVVEVGYAIDPEHRRRGHARGAMRVMLDRARSDPAVKKVLASVRPDNEPSLNLVAQFGFERWVSRLTTRTVSNGCLASMAGSDALAVVNTRVVVQTSD